MTGSAPTTPVSRSRSGRLAPTVARLALAIGSGLVVSACGGDAAVEAAPTRVPGELVPDRLLDELAVIENTDESTKEALADDDPSTLVSDTRVWEIRRGQRLVGTLQISTVLPKVDLTDIDVRESLVAQVILGQHSRIRVGDVEVFTTTTEDKTVYLWFGADVFEVVQTKARGFEPEDLVEDLIAFQSDRDEWQPLPELLDFDE